MLIRSWTFRNEIQCYYYDRTQALKQWVALRENVPASEFARAERMNSAERAQTFLLARSLLRKKLSEILNFAPESFEILLTPIGKPFLSDDPQFVKSNADLPSFSLSHSENRILIAISPNAWTFGADIQYTEHSVDFERISERLFSDEHHKEITRLSGEA